jgi:hypothetical protein
VYAKVYMGSSHPPGTLIDFYNKLFIRKMKQFIAEIDAGFAPPKQTQEPSGTLFRTASTLNLFMSPLKHISRSVSLPASPGIPATPSLQTPRTLKLISSGEIQMHTPYVRVARSHVHILLIIFSLLGSQK